MSSLSNVIEFPVRREVDERDSLEHGIVLALATADDLAAGIADVVERIHRDSGAARVEWWVTDDDGTLELVASAGIGRGTRHKLPLGRAGAFVLHGGRLDPQIASALMSLTPIVRRRAAEERLARTTIGLARRNEALEDFAALVAHELKTPLQAALVADDPSSSLEDALDLVEALLEAAQNESDEMTFASAAECLDQAVEDLRVEVEITTDLTSTLPLPPGSLRVIFRNLLSNAVAAGARHVHVAAARSPRAWRLLLDDDGVGLAESDRYAAGSGLGLSLCRRIAERFGGALDLAPCPSGGTRATLEFAEATR
jgi:signal transduction histidine kinase